jgi:hypothetical protein
MRKYGLHIQAATLATRLVAAVSLGLFAGCPAATTDHGVADGTDRIAGFASTEIVELVYDTAYRVPPAFYVDERASNDDSYTLYHVKDESNSYEVCTDQFDEASTIESADNDARAVQGLYVGSYENSRYFEFVRELANPGGVGNVPESTSPGYARVFKCNYVDLVGVDRNLHNGFAGRLAVSPPTLEVTKEFVEYLWQFVFFWPAQAKVIGTHSGASATSYWHTLVLAVRTVQGGGKCDRIDVVEWQFLADKATGEMEKAFVPLSSFEANILNGVPALCPGVP